MRWSVENGLFTPESIAITGGRAAYSSNGWAANYYITDHLGSVRAVTDAEGEVLDTFDYMPYGRFISIDPKAESFYHISPYTYCAGDPVNMVDPDGEATKAIITAYKYSKRLVSLYKKYGKITSKTLKDAGLSELVDIAGDLHTIFSGDTTFGDKVGALADLIVMMYQVQDYI